MWTVDAYGGTPQVLPVLERKIADRCNRMEFSSYMLSRASRHGLLDSYPQNISHPYQELIHSEESGAAVGEELMNTRHT